ncbi:acyl-CoA N-acyltransferase [Basidiobolus meristosporus CBS 931.73]|uniref:Acyl-CoA N-acyltransferase n=1 Tax=Basidiobolus meristosporus CBS 931.73 TaxID=1314790 RepID=A0A1Y1XTT0_9FUNG|nr:acyl-CoA N-acyltransferase [Basidiobolus meristosporus CBS 931.73]|eukprot:ORX89113.1 acyl-CoA N-acyltransferase [Basidiobolus meristosporus CBS 931.73]
MVGVEMKTYAMMRSQIVEWETFAAENAWAKETAEREAWNYSDLPGNCVAVYYVVDNVAKAITNKLHVVTWSSEYKREFKELNLLWVKGLFEVEESDVKQLDYPEENILKTGGQIFFLLEGKKVAGTVATIVHDGQCELGKMTVADEYQGRGYAHPLMQEAISWAKREGYPNIILLTALKLIKAVALYKKHGFETIHLGKHPHYERCDIIMQLTF